MLFRSDGYIRIDGFSGCGLPNLAGATITPAPFVASLPLLTQLAPPRIGHVHPVRCASAPGDVVSLYLSSGTSQLPVPPFGMVELDLGQLWSLGAFTVPTIGIDPLAAVDVPVPNDPGLVGLTLYAQAVIASTTALAYPRLSNRLTLVLAP